MPWCGKISFGGVKKIRTLANESKALRGGFSSTVYHVQPTDNNKVTFRQIV